MENIEALSPIIFQPRIFSPGKTLQLFPIPVVETGPGAGEFLRFQFIVDVELQSYIVNTQTEAAQGSGNINSGPAVVRRPSSLAEIFIFDVLISDLAAGRHQQASQHKP